MADDRTFRDNADLQGLQGDAIIELMTLDLQPIDASISPTARYLRFCNWVVSDGVPLVYGGLTYVALPYKANGFTYQTEGVPPSPTLTVSNVGLEFTQLINTWNDLVGAKLTRRRVLAKHLDSGSSPDPNAHWPDETWTVQQKEAENKLFVTFRLSTAFDLDGVMLPHRRALRYTCPWVYRGEGCDYAGPPVADVENQRLTTSTEPILQTLYNATTSVSNAFAARVLAQDQLAAAKAATVAAADRLAAATLALDGLIETRYNRVTIPRNYVESSDNGSSFTSLWNGAPVSIGTNTEFRRGNFQEYASSGFARAAYYAIERWGFDYASGTPAEKAEFDAATAAHTAAVAAEAAANTTHDNSITTYNNAHAAYDTAYAAWLASGLADAADQCGKTLQSCRLRFVDPTTNTAQDLPFGGFPGLTL